MDCGHGTDQVRRAVKIEETSEEKEKKKGDLKSKMTTTIKGN